MEYNSFIFYESWFNMAEKMPDEADRLELFNAIVSYAFTGIEPVLNGVFSSVAWEGIRPLIQANKKNKSNGVKGGRPKKTTGFENEKPPVSENNNHRFSEIKTTGFENEETNVNSNSNNNNNSNSNSNENKESERELFNIDSISTPTIDQVISYGKMPEVNLSEEECRKCFNYYDARDWMDNTGRSLKWRPLVRNWSARKNEFIASSTTTTTPNQNVDYYSLQRAFEWYYGRFLGDYPNDPKNETELRKWAEENGIYDRLKNKNDKMYQHVYK